MKTKSTQKRVQLTAKEKLANAKTELDFHSKVLQVHEGIWQATWASAKNPFEAWNRYKQDAPKRKPIVSAWLTARAYYDSLPKPRTVE